MLQNSSVKESKSGVVYWALNDYGVTAFDIAICVIMVTLASWIVTLNALVLDTLVRVKGANGTREPADWLVSSLSLADLVTGLFLVYNTAYNMINFQATVFIALTWVVSLLLALIPALGWNLDSSEDTGPAGETLPVCSYFGLHPPDYLRLVVSIFFVPFVVMIFLYAHIFKVANRHARVIAAQEGGKTRERHSWKYTKTVVIVMGLYFFCWLPVGLVIILHVQGYLGDYTLVEKGTMVLYASVPAYANSIINPIIYAIKVSAVRARFRAIFCRGDHSQVQPDISMTQHYAVRPAWGKAVNGVSHTAATEMSSC
ncbi:hypothetical protein BaRGS_00009075 [Batillaria attramentaria]|uniref:G-protein coupled receptors family 1 profile domain-containing protein n=1 Tax=Batillaria attramentaria TaxID=370345 RepID=A0ABD0LL82_9CAEN